MFHQKHQIYIHLVEELKNQLKSIILIKLDHHLLQQIYTIQIVKFTGKTYSEITVIDTFSDKFH